MVRDHRSLCGAIAPTLRLILLCVTMIQATLIATSKVTRCINDGSEVLDCAQKMVVALTVSPTGATQGIIASAQTDTGESVRLGNPIRIEVQTTAVPRLLFPISYVQTVSVQTY